jgi:hypothetical protein
MSDQRHAVYRVTTTGRVPRVPFASMPTAAARRYVERHPDYRLLFVPPIPDDDHDDTLGPCGCVDYHMADCPTRTGGSNMTSADYLALWERRGSRDDYMTGDEW